MGAMVSALERIRAANSKYKPDHGHELFHRLREARIARGLSQHALAEKIGCSDGDFHRYEKREHLPNSDTFVAWLQALEFTIVPPE
jgi:ribosome-binding protein aMBF1 (putative translation factor)